VDQAVPSFSKGMLDLSLPETWNPHKRNIVIFNSSEDEFASIGPEFHHRPFADQLEALRFISKWVADKHDIDIYLRMHPRLQKIANSSVTDLYQLNSQNFYVIRPDSPSNTYTLIDHCDAVLTFGSTTGIEATFWGKPSILIGTAMYESFDVVHQVTNKQDLANAILRYSDVKPRENTLPYGLYMSNFGIPYKYYQPDTFDSGMFKGRYISSDSVLLNLSKARLSKKLFWPLFKIWHDHVM
jgi:capsule polysaccharide export protein KpsC/LpsZ